MCSVVVLLLVVVSAIFVPFLNLNIFKLFRGGFLRVVFEYN